MSGEKTPDRPAIELAKSSYQPSKAELEETIDLGNLTPEEVTRALLEPIDVKRVSRPQSSKHPNRRHSR